MEPKDNSQNVDELLEFDLDDILNEFHSENGDIPEAEAEADSILDQLTASQADGVLPETEEPQPEPVLSQEVPADFDPLAFDLPQEETAPQATIRFDTAAVSEEAAAEAPALEPTQAVGDLSQEAPMEPAPEGDTLRMDSPDQTFRMDGFNVHAMPDDQDDTHIPQSDPQMRLRDLKRKLVAGPEKRYYTLSEMGLGKLQIAILINIVVVLICAVASVMFYLGRVPEDRMRLMIFGQVLAMLVSALLGSQLMIDGLGDVFRGRFSLNTLLTLTFLACGLDAFFCLRDLRVPCCAAFSLEMTLALCARYQSRNTEMAQMDTLRKAVRLRSLVKSPNFFENTPGLLRGDGELEDFWDIYEKSSGPRKVQNFYAFLALLMSLAIAGLAGMLHGAAMGVQILATSLLVAAPASFFVALTRPESILERRLHMVGAVLCGWQGVKGLSSKLVFPLTDSDLFPHGSTKLNGVKFYSDRDPDMIISYTASLIMEAGGGLVPIFQQLMTSRGVAQNPVQNFQDYGNGGIGGDVCGESVLLGTYSFLQSMGVLIPEGSMVNQAVYAAIDGQLCAVVAISYARMRTASAGMVTICGYRKLQPVFTGADFILTEDYIRSKFEIKTKRLRFTDPATRQALAAQVADPSLPSLALVTRDDLASFAYAVTGARALRTSCRIGMILHLVGGLLGLLIMLVLGILGNTALLTPMNVFLFQLVWLIPGLLITEWTRNV